MTSRPLRVSRRTCNSKVLGYSKRRCGLAGWNLRPWREGNINILDILNEDLVTDGGGDSRVSFGVKTQVLERRVGEDTRTEADKKTD